MIVSENDASMEAALADYFERLDDGQSVSEASFLSAYPHLAMELRQFFDDERALHVKVNQFSSSDPGANRLQICCPNCHQRTEVAADSKLTDLKCSACGSRFSLVDETETVAARPVLTKLGRFDLFERLGMGAFGTVWKARDSQLDRDVAVKIPRQKGMRPEEQEKFFREARAAAQLRHPSIVSVHEVGREGDSIYIVSDFVEGVTLDDWLTGQRPTNREAAELCATIADALQHAHEKGVVHRDLKPANIMIDAEGALHLMDFGLARREVGEVTVTLDGQVLGTPAYMSPEQAAGNAHAAGPASDVYSMGVILFKLLTGELPFRGNTRMMLHQVINEEPPSPRRLNASVSCDLETITLKCLQKDPARRYPSARAVAEELRRYLAGRPIVARPVSWAAQATRWVRRNKLISALAATILVVLLSGVAISTKFAIEARAGEQAALAAKLDADRSRQEAESRQKEAEAVTNFLVRAFRSSDPSRDGRTITVAEILDRAEKELEKLTDQPLTQAALLQAINEVRPGLGLNESLANLTKAAELRSHALGAEHPDTLRSMETLAGALLRANRRTEAERMYENVLAIRRKTSGADDSATLLTMGTLSYVYRLNGRYEEAIELAEEAYDRRRANWGDTHGLTLHAATRLGAAYSAYDQFDKAVEIQEAVVAAHRKESAKGESLDTADLAAAYYKAGRYEQAIDASLETVAAREKRLGREHPDTRNSINVLALSYLNSNRPADAVPLLEEILAGSAKQFGDNDRATINYLMNMGRAYRGVDRTEDAIKVYERALTSSIACFGFASRDACDMTRALMELYTDKKQTDETLTRYTNHLADLREKHGEDHPAVKTIEFALIDFYQTADRTSDAQAMKEEFLKVSESNVEALNCVAWILATTAVENMRDGKRAVDLALKACELSSYRDPSVIDTLAAAYAETGDFEAAVKWSEKSVQVADDVKAGPLRFALQRSLDGYRAKLVAASDDSGR